jgi:hypothetical protein
MGAVPGVQIFTPLIVKRFGSNRKMTSFLLGLSLEIDGGTLVAMILALICCYLTRHVGARMPVPESPPQVPMPESQAPSTPEPPPAPVPPAPAPVPPSMPPPPPEDLQDDPMPPPRDSEAPIRRKAKALQRPSVRCGCCGAPGRTSVGCSCSGGKSHECLRVASL